MLNPERNKIYQGLCQIVLGKYFDDESVDCCITSPPYWGLRDYNVSGQIGLEPTPEEYVDRIVDVFREVRRVLKPGGTLWLNLGDSYANKSQPGGDNDTSLGRSNTGRTSTPHMKIPKGLKSKDLVGVPWMVAFALRADGWYLRQDIIWSKPNPMPESVIDRCTKSHEYIFLMSKSPKYYYDQDAIRVPLKDASIARLIQDIEEQNGSDRVPGKTNGNMKAVLKNHKIGGTNPCPDSRTHSGKDWSPKQAGGGSLNRNGHSGYFDKDGNPLVSATANKKSVWEVPTSGFKEAHFATFPEKLIEPMVLAGCPEGGLILDPFMGAGTTAVVAYKNNRDYVGIELNPEYIEMAQRRIRNIAPLFTENLG